MKVVPGADADEIAGWLGGRLKLRVTAPPTKGKANAAAAALLARRLGLSASAVRVVAGHGKPLKLVAVEGMNAHELRRRLDVP